MDSKKFVTAVIVAAGNSTRMGLGNMSKQFIPLLSRPAISYTLKAFENCGVIDEVVVVCRDEDREQIKNISQEYKITKLKALVKGGSERSESVKNGVLAANENATHFAIHDGARVLITTEEIEKVVTAAFTLKAATLGTQVTDTVKVVDQNGVIISTPDRSTLMAVQTPQVFEKNLYLEALECAKGKGFTDDCAMVEYFGVSPTVVAGSNTNIKLTTQTDIPLAENILRKRQESAQ